MIRFFVNFFSAAKFYFGVTLERRPKIFKPRSKLIQKMTSRQAFEKKQRARYLVHSMLKEGDSYKLGEATVTLARFGREGKEDVSAKIAAAAARRKERMDFLTKRGEDIMLMTKEQIREMQLEEWLEKRREHQEKIYRIMNGPDEPPAGNA